MVRSGYVAASAGIILLVGHVIIFVMLLDVPTVSSADLGDLRALVTPITIASLTGVVFWANDTRHKKLGGTQEVNWFFGALALFIPFSVLCACGVTVWQLELDQLSIADAKSNIAFSEASFGFMLSLIFKSLYGTP